LPKPSKGSQLSQLSKVSQVSKEVSKVSKSQETHQPGRGITSPTFCLINHWLRACAKKKRDSAGCVQLSFLSVCFRICCILFELFFSCFISFFFLVSSRPHQLSFFTSDTVMINSRHQIVRSNQNN